MWPEEQEGQQTVREALLLLREKWEHEIKRKHTLGFPWLRSGCDSSPSLAHDCS